jgi:hypothetical protein
VITYLQMMLPDGPDWPEVNSACPGPTRGQSNGSDLGDLSNVC